ncbi:MAG: hypothetical protein VYC39_00725, partial [Myxococcota bacterium]|nr:hypothetical protein [Myxococcota bacterium]
MGICLDAKSCLGTLLLLFYASCSALPDDVAPPEDAPKLSPRNIACDGAGPQIGGLDFYFDSFSNWGRQTCKQRFEQDGCGLSIFRDCQDSKRQWAGTIDEDLRISMKPIF